MRPVGGVVIEGRAAVRRDVRRVAEVRTVGPMRTAVGAARRDLKRPARGVRRGMVGWMLVSAAIGRRNDDDDEDGQPEWNGNDLGQAKRAPK